MKVFTGLVVAVAAHPTFEEWAAEYGFNGADDVMKTKYEANLKLIDEMNAADNGATFAVNKFSGMSPEEFEQTMLNFKPEQSILNTSGLPVVEVDYSLTTAVGAKEWTVSPVKDQGSCGSCWAFGAVAGLEGEAIRQLSRNDILSEQYVMDCTSSAACSGGRADSAYPKLYGKELYTLASYPYTASNGNCHTGTDSGLRITSFTKAAGPLKDSALAAALDGAAQVIAVGASSWSSYSGGIYAGSTSCSLNHQVYLTGYDTDYFKVKNSWGKSWGESGYIRLKRTDSGCGTSGILSDGAFFPVMEGGSPTPTPEPTPTPPIPPPAPTPTPTPGQTHYGAPPCMSDEMADDFVDDDQTVLGKICAAPCGAGCPSDTPGGTATPACILQDDSGGEYCGLECGLLGGDCPDGSMCSSQLVGVCYWPSTGVASSGQKLHLVKKEVTV